MCIVFSRGLEVKLWMFMFFFGDFPRLSPIFLHHLTGAFFVGTCKNGGMIQSTTIIPFSHSPIPC